MTNTDTNISPTNTANPPKPNKQQNKPALLTTDADKRKAKDKWINENVRSFQLFCKEEGYSYWQLYRLSKLGQWDRKKQELLAAEIDKQALTPAVISKERMKEMEKEHNKVAEELILTGMKRIAYGIKGTHDAIEAVRLGMQIQREIVAPKGVERDIKIILNIPRPASSMIQADRNGNIRIAVKAEDSTQPAANDIIPCLPAAVNTDNAVPAPLPCEEDGVGGGISTIEPKIASPLENPEK